MKKSLLCLTLALALTACGGGSSKGTSSSSSSSLSSSSSSLSSSSSSSSSSTAVIVDYTSITGTETTIQELSDGFCELDGVLGNKQTGFTGPGYANTDNKTGAGINWEIELQESSPVGIRFHFSNAAAARPAVLTFGDQTVSLNFESTGSWSAWQDQTIGLMVEAGKRSIHLSATGSDGLPFIDSITLVSAENIAPVACIPGQEGVDTRTKVLIIGDSTVADYNANAYPMTGWGQVIGHFFDENAVVVANHAIGGRSSRSFYQDGTRWEDVKAEMHYGDYLLIQFGHNDRDFSKPERYTSVEDYKTYLNYYITDAKTLGVTPVLVSPMIMNAYSNGTLRNVFTESGNDYAGAMAEVAATQNVAYIDLNQASFDLIQSVGEEYATRFLFNNYLAGEYPNYPDGNTDFTHFQEQGAVEMARLITEGAEALTARNDMQTLIAAIKPRYELTVSAAGSTGSAITHTNSYPEGAPLTLKTLVANEDTLNGWFRWGKKMGASNIYNFAMHPNASTYVASFNANLQAEDTTPAKVFLVGDSTVAYWDPANYYPLTGWGQELQHYFDTARITVDNRALSARSSKSFYNDHWAAVKADIRAGDYVFFQFGINDRKSEDPARYAPVATDLSGDLTGTFQGYMKAFVEETQALGAKPILVSTIVGNSWNQDGTVYDAYHEHPIAMRELAHALNVPLVDLDMRTRSLLESVGQKYSTYFYYNNLKAGEYPKYAAGNSDWVHLQEAGAVEVARLVTEEIEAMASREEISPLASATKPRYGITITSNTSPFGLHTIGYEYPDGTPFTLKALPNDDAQLESWYESNGNVYSTNLLNFITTGDMSSAYSVEFVKSN